MKKNTNLFLLFFFHLFFLVSCTDNTTTAAVNCPTNSTSNTQITANSIQVNVISGDTLLPFEGAMIQLDNNGSCLLTDQNGFVRFDGLSPAKHDVHLFGGSEYRWASEYYVDALSGNRLNLYLYRNNRSQTPETRNISYVNLGGSISNAAVDSNIRFSYASEPRRLYSGFSSIKNNSSSYNYEIAFETDINTSISNELWVFESTRNSNGDYVLVDAFLIPQFTTNTTTETGAVNTNNVILQDAFVKPAQSTLLGINNITFPVGFTANTVYFAGSFKSTDFPTRTHNVVLFSHASSSSNPIAITPNSIIEAYITPFDFVNLYFSISASNSNLSYWSYYTNKFLVGENNISISPKISNIPLIPPNQRGRTISWDTVDNGVERQSLYISARDRNFSGWDIRINGNSNSVTLPELPNGLSAVLMSGVVYNLTLFGGYDISEITAGNKFTYEGESYSVVAQWVR